MMEPWHGRPVGGRRPIRAGARAQARGLPPAGRGGPGRGAPRGHFPEGLPAGTIAERLGTPPSSLTFHLQQLRNAGLVTQRRVSRQIIYAIVPAAMNGLVAYLTENCCGGQPTSPPACEPAATAPRSRKTPAA